MMAADAARAASDRPAAAGARPARPPTRRSAPLTWFRVGGPAEVLFRPADDDDLADFLAALPRRRAGDGDRRRLEPAGARRRHPGRGGPARPRLRRDRGRRRRGRRRRRRARPQRRAEPRPRPGSPGSNSCRGIPGTIGGGLRMNAGAYGSEIKDVLIARRWRSTATAGAIALDAGRARPLLSPLRRARGLDLHRRALARAARATARRSPRAWPRSRRRARRRSRSARAPAARPSPTRPATRPGS